MKKKDKDNEKRIKVSVNMRDVPCEKKNRVSIMMEFTQYMHQVQVDSRRMSIESEESASLLFFNT